MSASAPLPFKPLANMHFNQHGGRRGVRSATSVGEKMLKKTEHNHQGHRPGPMGMGHVVPHKPNAMFGENATPPTKQYSHFHQLHEKYNEK